jgi:hypothetical protein
MQNCSLRNFIRCRRPSWPTSRPSLRGCGAETRTVERSISNRPYIPHAIAASKLLRRAAAISAARVPSSSAASTHKTEKGRAASINGFVEPRNIGRTRLLLRPVPLRSIRQSPFNFWTQVSTAATCGFILQYIYLMRLAASVEFAAFHWHLRGIDAHLPRQIHILR